MPPKIYVPFLKFGRKTPAKKQGKPRGSPCYRIFIPSAVEGSHDSSRGCPQCKLKC